MGTATRGLTTTVSRIIAPASPTRAALSSPSRGILARGRYGRRGMPETDPRGDDTARVRSQPRVMSNLVMRPRVLGQWLRFAVVGGCNTLLSWCAYALLVHLGLAYVVASGLAFTLGALNS